MRRLAVALLGTVCWAGPALAQPASDPAFDEGRKRLEAGDYAGACAKFQETWDSAHSPGKAFNLSVCEEKQGHLRRAQSWMREGMLLLAKDDDRLSGAVERVQTLEKRLPYMKIVVSAPTDGGPVDSPIALVDDQPVAASEAVPVDPGRHVVKLSAAGRANATVEITLEEGERKDVPIAPGALDTKKEDTPVTPPPAKIEPSPPAPSAGQRIAGFVIGGVGLATLGGALGMAFLANSTHDDFEEAKSAGQPTGDIADKGRTVNVVEGALLGIGGAALVTGVIVVLTAPKAGPSKPASVADIRVVPSLGPKGGGAWILGQF
ncbi:MAG: hypothetical protein U0414_10490 [Polyangiaceae bacterium]